MTVNVSGDIPPVHPQIPKEEIKKDTTVGRDQIPAAKNPHPSIQNVDQRLAEVKNQTLVLTNEQISAIQQAVNSNDSAYLKQHLTPTTIAAYNRQAHLPLLHYCILCQNKDATQLVLSHKTDLDVVDNQGDSAVHIAANDYDIDFLRLVLEGGCSPNVHNNEVNTPLHHAAIRDQGFIQLLLDKDANPKALNNNGYTPGLLAKIRNKPENAELLRKASQGFDDIWAKTKMLGHRFGLTSKVQVGNREVKIGGFHPKYTWKELERSIRAWMKDPSFFVPYYKDGTPVLNEEDMEDICLAIRQGDSANPIDPQRVEDGDLIMIQSGYQGHATSVVNCEEIICFADRSDDHGRPGIIVYELLEQDLLPRDKLLQEFTKSLGSETNAPFNNQKLRSPPYMREIDYLPHQYQDAANCAWASSAKLSFRAALYAKLKSKGVSLPIAKQYSLLMYKTWTPFDRRMGLQEYMSDPYLLKDKHTLKMEGIDRSDILQQVYLKSLHPRFAPVMGDLLATGEINARGPRKIGKRGETALHIAVISRNIPLVHDLIAKGLDVNSQDKNGTTPFHIACAIGDPVLIDALSPNAIANVSDLSGVTPLHIAAVRGDAELMRSLLIKKADCFAIDTNSRNALHYATQNPNPDVVKALIEAGTPPWLGDKQGVTPLHIACAYGHYELVRDLLNEEYVDPNAKDEFGNTPFTLACQWNQPTLIELMLEKGANLEAGLAAASKYNNQAIVKLLQSKKKAS